jgi:putative transposase
MPRPRRFDIPGVPLHVVQRGNNRNACFFGDIDRRFYLTCLSEAATRRNVAVNAYVLMSNHVHLLLTPGQPGAVGALLQDVGRKYVRVFNTIHGRTGTLWEGRYKSSLVADERYLLACHRYIELNPVRAGMASDPGDYRWSSYRHYAYGHVDPLITEHGAYAALAGSPSGRRERYRAVCAEACRQETLTAIREAINANCEIGSDIPKRGRPTRPAVAANDDSESRNLF